MELLDALVLRRWLVVLIVAGISVAGVAVASFLPELLPPRALAGAAVGLAACLLAVAAAITVDAGDPVVRGPRHVLATGAALAAEIVGADPNEEFVDWVEQRLREQDGLRLAILATGDDPMASGWLADELGAALARRGLQILVTDLHQPKQDWPGASEVSSGEMRLSEVVEFHPTLRLARLGSGHDHEAALAGFPALAARLPRDVDAFIVALPGLPRPGTLPAAAAADRALLLVAAGRTTRVELIAALDAIDEARVPSDVVLVSAPWTADRLEPLPPSNRIEPEGITILTPPAPGSAPTSDPGASQEWDAPRDPDELPGKTQVETQVEDTVSVLAHAEAEPDGPTAAPPASPPGSAPRARRVTISSTGPARKPPSADPHPTVSGDRPSPEESGGRPRRRRSNPRSGDSGSPAGRGGRGTDFPSPALSGRGSPATASAGEWLASGTVRMVEPVMAAPVQVPVHRPVQVLDRDDPDATAVADAAVEETLGLLVALPDPVDDGEPRIDDPEASLRLALALDRLTEKLSDACRRPMTADASEGEIGALDSDADHPVEADDRRGGASRSRSTREGFSLRSLSEGPSFS